MDLKESGADAPRTALTVFFVCSVVQILFVIGLRAKPAPGASVAKFFWVSL